MAALKDVRQRMRAVKGIQQVTRAMKMVATVKVKRIQDRLLETRPYVDALYDMAGRLAAAAGPEGQAHTLLAEPSGDLEVLIVMGSDRGLCGSFNTNLLRFAVAQSAGRDVRFIPVGRKAKDFFTRRRLETVKSYEKLPFPMTWEEAERLARDVMAAFPSFVQPVIRIAYQRFVSPGISKPTVVSWLPFRPSAKPTERPLGGSQPPAKPTERPLGGSQPPEGAKAGELRCEPSAVEALDFVLPRAQTAQLQRTILESQASEMGARMVAMDNATTNAGELIRELNLLANKLRQTGITKELLEITTGAEALAN